VQSELLELADEPIETSINTREIELDNVYDGLESGRWMIVSGERDDITGVTGVKARELLMISGVTQYVDLTRPGDTTHTTILFANTLAFSYKRDTVTINANVVRATHGETRSEVLGSGDGSKTLQSFALKQSPLTYVSAITPAGIESTLQVRVNDVLWHESDSLVGVAPTERRYITQTDNDRKTTIIFGDGVQGSRVLTGIENVKAVYRIGIGKPGNVPAEQISLLTTRPLGVKGVINPLPATGGADPEDRDHARRNTPLHLKALDRAVSVPDYADFARAFNGIGKARAIRLSDGRRELVHLTIAGADDIPIDTQSDLYRNLLQALHQFGDPNQPVQLDPREPAARDQRAGEIAAGLSLGSGRAANPRRAARYVQLRAP
jgi:predicted phage baseplate assembly protein